MRAAGSFKKEMFMDNLRKKASEAVRALRSRSFLVTLLAMTVSVAVLWIAFGADAVYIRITASCGWYTPPVRTPGHPG